MNFDIPELDCYTSLWMAVLQQSVMDVKAKGYDTELAARSARIWFRSKSSKIGSFIWVCNVLNLESEIVLEGIRQKLREQDRKVLAPSQVYGSDGRSRGVGLAERAALPARDDRRA